MSAGGVVLDAAGGGIGGAARWASELDRFLAHAVAPVTVIGRHRPLTPDWLVRREGAARGADLAVAINNASFAWSGKSRRVLLRNALHFLDADEAHLLAPMSRSFRAQIPVVRRLLTRADTVVVPSSAMAERVGRQVPSVRDRIVVRPHPVTPIGPRVAAIRPFILVPVLPAPYKNLLPQLAALLDAVARTGTEVGVHVTAHPTELPSALAWHPRLTTLGVLSPAKLGAVWQRATAAYYPSNVEAFGYPLAEARAYGVPVLAPDTAQAREIAGPALRPYRSDDPASLAVAVAGLAGPDGYVDAEPAAFDASEYFHWLFDLPSLVPARPLIRGA